MEKLLEDQQNNNFNHMYIINVNWEKNIKIKNKVINSNKF